MTAPAHPWDPFPSFPLDWRGNPFSEAWRFSEEGEPPPRIQAFQERPLAYIGAWEPLSFRRRAGYAYTDEEDHLRENEFSDTALDHYVETGATAVVFPFAKGFGLKATQEELAQEGDVMRRARARGLFAGAYIRVDALIPELVIQDCPDVMDWLATGMYGRHSPYSPQQTFRKRICLSHPGAIQWIERLLDYAVRELDADFLHLDGFHTAHRPWEACRCHRCLGIYRQWLRVRFADSRQRARLFGIVDFDRMEFPDFEPRASLPTVLSASDMQAWYLFQWERCVAFVRHIRRFLLQLSPRVALTINPPGTSRVAHAPRIICQAVEPLLPWVDMVMVEDGLHLGFLNGSICSRIGLHKTIREYGIPLGHYHWEADPRKIGASLALSIAANAGSVSCLGFSFRYLPHYTLGWEEKRRMTRWARDHWALLGQTRPYGEIALLRHFPSLAWNGREPWHAAMGIEQILVRMRVPWRMLDRLTKEVLSGIRTLLLPDMESLADAELSLLCEWVRQGGRLFFTGRSGTHDEFRRRRSHPAIPAWLPGGDVPVSALHWHTWYKEDFSEEETRAGGFKGESWIEPLGSGLLGYWPRIGEGHATCLVNSYIRPEEWVAPSNADAIETFIRELHGPFDIEVEGPSSLLVEVTRCETTGEILIHLIQVDPSVSSTDVTIHWQDRGAQFRWVLTPEGSPPRVQHEDTSMRVFGIDRYAIVGISKKQKKDSEIL